MMQASDDLGWLREVKRGLLRGIGYEGDILVDVVWECVAGDVGHSRHGHLRGVIGRFLAELGELGELGELDVKEWFVNEGEGDGDEC